MIRSSLRHLHWQLEQIDFLLSISNDVFLYSAVDPVVQGKTKAQQFYKNDENGEKVTIAIFVLSSEVSSLQHYHQPQ